MYKRPLFISAIFFIFGIVLAKFLPDGVGFIQILVITAIFILLSFVVWARFIAPETNGSGLINQTPAVRSKIPNIFLLLSVTSFGVLLYVHSNIFPANHISHFLGEEKIKAEIVGVVRSPALKRQQYYGKIASTYLFELESIKMSCRGGPLCPPEQNVNGLAQIRIETEKDYGYGDRLLVKGTIGKAKVKSQKSKVKNENSKQIQNPNNKNSHIDSRFPHFRGDGNDSNRFNYREYLEKQDIFALINTKEKNVTLLRHNYRVHPILKYPYLIHVLLKNRIIEKMQIRSGGFLRSILIGDRSELPKDIQEGFKNSGTMHIISISGLHVGLIGGIILYLLRFFRIRREFSYLWTIIFLIFFSLLTLSSPPVVRSVVMMTIFLIGRLLGRNVDIYNSLGAACIFILLKNPKDLFNVGFQLSFSAVLSIAYFYPKIMTMVKDRVNPVRNGIPQCGISNGVNIYIKRYLYIPLAISISASLGTFPLILYYFNVITPIAIIANIFIIPMTFIILVGGLTFLVFGTLPFIGGGLAWFNDVCAFAIFYTADFFADLKFGHFYF